MCIVALMHRNMACGPSSPVQLPVKLLVKVPVKLPVKLSVNLSVCCITALVPDQCRQMSLM